MYEVPFIFGKLSHILEKKLNITHSGAETIIMSSLVFIIILFLSIITTSPLKLIPRNRLQGIMEITIELLLRFCTEIFEDKKKAVFFLPLIGTLALFIFLSNIIGLIPSFKSPTSSWSTTIALAVVVFFSTHIFGIKEKGFVNYFREFLGPMWYLAWLTLPINIIDHLARVLSLSLRLFANMMAKHFILTLLAATVVILSNKPLLLLQTFGIPVLLMPFVMGLGIITCGIQAFIFTLLALIYISEATHTSSHKE